MTKQIKLATAVNPMAARLIERYQITEEAMEEARNGRMWTKDAYADYLQSAHWQAFRVKVLARYKHKCMLCSSQERLEIHHNDYSRLGGELLTDCIPLCRDCHGRHHEIDY